MMRISDPHMSSSPQIYPIPIMNSSPSASSSDEEDHDSDSSSTSSMDSSSDEDSSQELLLPSSPKMIDGTRQGSICGDSLAFVPLLIPVIGICTMISTVMWSCWTRFDCTHHYPTLSYAATFYPEGRVFTIGMCLVSLLIGSTTVLMRWYFRLHLSLAIRQHQVFLQYAFDPMASLPTISLAVLAIYDMKNHHDVHIASTIIFFVSGWIVIGLFHFGRLQVAQVQKSQKKSSADMCSILASRSSSSSSRSRSLKGLWWGRVFIMIGLGATLAFALLFLCVNHVVSNVLGFTAFQEALAELMAIVCQLLYMGTLAEEISGLNDLIEREYSLLLSRAD